MTAADDVTPDGATDAPSADGTEILPMFPLGSVLFPAMPLPLRIFEPRYVRLLGDVLEGDARFGVVLIERGSEVGGDDVRSDIGTVAKVVSAGEVTEGLFAVVAVGTEVVDVVEWLPDDPYPRARVRPRAEAIDDVPADLVRSVTADFRRVLALATEAGTAAVPATVDLAEDPTVRSNQIAGLAPLGPFDQQRILRAVGSAERLRLTAELLADTEELLRAGLSAGPDADDGGAQP